MVVLQLLPYPSYFFTH